MGSTDEMDEREADNDARSSSDSDANAEANVFPVIERRYEPVPDLDDRLRSIYALFAVHSPPNPSAGTEEPACRAAVVADACASSVGSTGRRTASTRSA